MQLLCTGRVRSFARNVGSTRVHHHHGPVCSLIDHKGRSKVALYMFQFAYTSESWAAQIKNPQNRIEQVGRAATEAAGGKFIGGWICMGEYDAVLIADVPD